MMGTSTDGTATTPRLERRTVRVDAGEISIREAGSGAALLFVHGWGANGDLWTETATLLAAGHRVIVPDLPWGSQRIPLREDADLSPLGAAAIVADLIGTLALEDLTVVANDAGGAVSQILVTEHPGLVSRLVLTNCDALEQFPPDDFKTLVKALKIPGFSTLLHRTFGIRAVQRSKLGYGRLARNPIPDEILDSFRRPSVEDKEIRRDSFKFASAIDPKYTLDAAAKASELDLPVLLVWGDADPFFTLDLGRRLERVFKDSRLVIVPGAYCFVPLDEPKRLAEEVEAFVA